MHIVLDVGNTNVKFGVFEKDKLLETWRMATDLRKTSDEFGVGLLSMMAAAHIDPKDIHGVIMSSVVPAINFTLEHMLADYLHLKPLVVGSGIKTGINIKTDNPKEVGGDIICDAVSAFYRYGGPCITVDFGTATTISVIDGDGAFLGCTISLGVRGCAAALSNNAAKLPSVALELPGSVIGKNTTACMQSGLLYGYIGQVEYIINAIKEETGFSAAKVIATGGVAKTIAVHTAVIDVVDTKLTLEGLHLIYNMNKEGKKK